MAMAVEELASAPGFGRLGMKERVRQPGGTLTVGNTQATGVIVRALLPADG